MRTALLYPLTYATFVVFATLDIVLTWVILLMGGNELNWIAAWIIRRFDLPGVVVYKFALLVGVVVICELIGRRNRMTGQKLALWAVAISAFPVALAALLLSGRIG